MLLGKLATLGKARTNPHLRSEERPVLETAIDGYERQLALLDLRSAIAAGEADARRRALAIARGRGHSTQTRLEAAAMAAAPAVAGRVRRRAAVSWVGAGGLRVRRG